MSSHQPSSTDQLKQKAQTAYDTVARTIAPSSTQESGKDESREDVKRRDLIKDDQGQVCQRGDFQDQLSRAARGKREEEEKEEDGEGGIFGKVAAMIPGTATSKSEEPSSNTNETGISDGGVQRPEHDVQVEEFLRRQYRSKSGKDMSNGEER